MIASATAEQYERSLGILLEDDAVDAVVTIFVQPRGAQAAAVARGIAAAARGADRPVLCVFGAGAPDAGNADAVPRFSTPEVAVRALAHAARYARRRAAPPDPPSELADVDTAAAATVVAEGLGRGAGGWLSRTWHACCAAGVFRWWRAGSSGPRTRPAARRPSSAAPSR